MKQVLYVLTALLTDLRINCKIHIHSLYNKYHATDSIHSRFYFFFPSNDIQTSATLAVAEDDSSLNDCKTKIIY